ncbi:MAG: DUF58 domain-containing protein [Nocardioidaceae bacterium]|nr:DUF58 domain-containing protein [Nocardioidaceae bacterium]
MAAFFDGLTLRGRGFLAAGVTAMICAIVLGQPALVRIGALLAILPLLAAFAVTRRRPRLRVNRSVSPALVQAGESVQITLRILSDEPARPRAILVEDLVPYALGSRPRFVLPASRARSERVVNYLLRSDLRGCYPIGPLQARAVDPFGLFEARHTIGVTTDVLVAPRVVPLPPIPLAGGLQGAGAHRPRPFALGSAEDTSVREYRRGDDLRRVHWRSSARIGELMVRREEQPWEAHATVLVDNRECAHRGRARASSFESAITAAASAVVHLEQHGYAAQLVTSTGVVTSGADAALHLLSVLDLAAETTLDSAWANDRVRGGVVVAVLGDLQQLDTPTLRRIRHGASAALGLVFDVEQWSPTHLSNGSDAACVPLRALGWRAAGLGPRDRLDHAWRDLGQACAHHGSPR